MRNTTARSAILLAAALQGWAQTPAGPEFDAASIKLGGPMRGPNDSDLSGGPGTKDPERINIHNVNLKSILVLALGGGADTATMPGSRVLTPDWMDRLNLDIVAKVAAGATKQQANQMMLNLLKDRFQLKYHHELRPFDGYELTIAKGGFKGKESANRDAPPAGAANIKYVENDFPQVESGFMASPGRVYNGRVFQTFRGRPIAQIANMAMTILGTGPLAPAQVEDKTGLTGKYDFNLQYASTSRTLDADPPGGPGFAAALEKQLGLKLEKKRITLDVVVVDSADKAPSDN